MKGVNVSVAGGGQVVHESKTISIEELHAKVLQLSQTTNRSTTINFVLGGTGAVSGAIVMLGVFSGGGALIVAGVLICAAVFVALALLARVKWLPRGILVWLALASFAVPGAVVAVTVWVTHEAVVNELTVVTNELSVTVEQHVSEEPHVGPRGPQGEPGRPGEPGPENVEASERCRVVEERLGALQQRLTVFDPPTVPGTGLRAPSNQAVNAAFTRLVGSIHRAAREPTPRRAEQQP